MYCIRCAGSLCGFISNFREPGSPRPLPLGAVPAVDPVRRREEPVGHRPQVIRSEREVSPSARKVAEHHHGPGEPLRGDTRRVRSNGQDERRSGFVVELDAGVVAPVGDLHAGEGHIPVGRAEHVGGARGGEDEFGSGVEGGAHASIVA